MFIVIITRIILSSEKDDVEGHNDARYCHRDVETGPDDRELVENPRKSFLVGQEHGFESGNPSEVGASADQQKGEHQQPIEGINVHFTRFL